MGMGWHKQYLCELKARARGPPYLHHSISDPRGRGLSQGPDGDGGLCPPDWGGGGGPGAASVSLMVMEGCAHLIGGEWEAQGPRV